MVGKRTPYRRRSPACNDVMERERSWCSRHRCAYPTWEKKGDRLHLARCLRCAEEEARVKPAPMGADHE